MNTLTKVGIGVGIIAIAVAVVPALKGPYNRIKNTANEKLDAEFVVDNYKAEYINLHNKKKLIIKNIENFKCEERVTAKKLEHASKKVEVAKKNLLEVGTSDMKKFARCKDAYESVKIEEENYILMCNSYSNAIEKLESTLALVNSNMNKAKANVAALESKKTLVDSIRSVNETVESINGISGESTLGMNIEKLDDDMLRESIRLDALREGDSIPVMDKAAADAYLKSLN